MNDPFCLKFPLEFPSSSPQEMDSIIDQMMTVAEYIGWETKELRPVSMRIGPLIRQYEFALCYVMYL